MKAKLSIGTIWRNAADCLGRFYWRGFGVSVLFTLVIAAVNSAVSRVTSAIAAVMGIESVSVNSEMLQNYSGYAAEIASNINVTDWRVSLVSSVLSFASALLVIWLLRAGAKAYFLEARSYPDKISLSDAFSPFGKYAKAIGYSFAYHWRLLIPELIAIPLVVLGVYMMNNVNTEIFGAKLIVVSAFVLGIISIIIEIRLFCLPYIFAQNSEISPKRAVELSAIMTEGYKGKIFWNSVLETLVMLAGALCCGVGVLFTSPYVYAVDAELYTFLYEVAKENGRIDSNEITTLVEYKESEIIES